MNPVRAAAVVFLLVSTGVLAHARRAAVPAVDVTQVPYEFGSWRGTDAPPLDAETRRILAADGYVNRMYSDGASAAVGLYVAYYREQRPAASIHSPLHCLPGTGWEPRDVGTISLAAVNGVPAAEIRRVEIRKNRERALVLYSYAVRNRLLASEMASSLWLLHDSVRFGRSDASLLRVVVPIGDSATAAEQRGLTFVRDVLPYMSRLWS
jgi:EpsI family protein